MAIAFPDFAPSDSTRVALKSNAADQTPTLGGPTQRVTRPGDRWIVEVSLRPMSMRQASAWSVALLQGLNDKVRCPLKLNGINLSAYSDGTVSQAVAGGSTIAHTGGGAAKFVGQYVSIVKDGTRYLHIITAVQGAALGILPALRTPLAGGETLEFGSPKIEGFLEGLEQSFTVGLVGQFGATFRIVEAL